MRFGPLEIGIIIVIILIIFAVTRMRLLGKNNAEKDKASVVRRTAVNNERARRIRSSRIQILGVIFVLVGILILLSSLNLLKWVFWGPIWASIIVVIGLATLFIARRRL